MVIREIKISGFRGVRGSIQIPFSPGFTVIVGRNGAGKTTICDAIEFAITGELSRFGPAETEKGERIADYLWWRGSGKPPTRAITATFQSDEGEFVQEVTPTGHTPLEARLFCEQNASDEDLKKLCQTSILRDELISKLSTDLSESDRFEFLNRAIGMKSLTVVEKRCADLEKQIRSNFIGIEKRYANLRDQVAALASEISSAQTEAARVAKIKLEEIYDQVADLLPVNVDRNSISGLVRLVVNTLAVHRSRSQKLETLSISLRTAAAQHGRLSNMRPLKTKIQQDLAAAKEQLERAEQGLREARATLAEISNESPRNAALALLAQTGEQLGRIEGNCPLCGLKIDERGFRQHIEEVRTTLGLADERVATVVKAFSDAQKHWSEAVREVERITSEANKVSVEMEALEIGLERIKTEAISLGLDLQPEQIERALEAVQRAVAKLENARAQLDSMLALERVSELQRHLTLAKEEMESIGLDIDRLSNAQQNARSITSTARRLSAENLDERLAAISPLLEELYVRLRPHVDFAEIAYRMRGDVRRFLSLEVGREAGLNPRFIFSSGQRRALGLAFLLAVHLSRPWCKLNTLILDDPIQHIDDYRALHLVEVLAAIRQRNKEQIICTVEDTDLADLLCRRLRAQFGAEGTLVQLSYVSETGIAITGIRQIGPFPKILESSGPGQSEAFQLQ